MKKKDQILLEETYQIVLENSIQQPTDPQPAAQNLTPKTQNAINALTQMSRDLQNPRLPNKENLITGIGNALQTLSREPGPYQQQAGQILKWLGQSQTSMKGPQGLVARGFVADKLPEEINKLLSSNSQQSVKEATTQPWVSSYANRSADLRGPSAKKQASDEFSADRLASAVIQFAQEPKLSELAKHYDPQGIYKKDPTPEQVKHDLKYLAFGNKRAQYSVIDPKQFQIVYKALQNKLKQSAIQNTPKPLNPMKGEAPSKQIARDLHTSLSPLQKLQYNLTGKH